MGYEDKSVKIVEGSADAIREVVKLGRESANCEVRYVDGARGIPFVIVPDGMQARSLANVVRDAPDRIRQNVEVSNVKSFSDYVNRFKTVKTVVFADVANGVFISVIDYHGAQNTADSASFRTHRCTLRMTKTEEFAAWDGADGKEMSQMDFATFIEEHLPDISKPTGAEMLELAKNIEATSNVQFTGKVNLTNDGRVLQFQEDITAKAGTLVIPESFTLYLEPFQGAPAMSIECRFRYRLEKPNVRLSFRMLRKRSMIQKMFEGTADVIREQVERPIYIGAMKD